MSILDTLMDAYPSKNRSEIIDLTEDLIAEYQSGNCNEVKVRDELFYLHLGLISKLCSSKRKMLTEDDIITCCLECILPAALKYDIEKGHERFSWVSFFMQRCTWKINEYYHRTNQLVYIPKDPWEKGKRFEYDYNNETLESNHVEEQNESYPNRLAAVHHYEVNTDITDPDDKLDIIIFKLHYLNKNTSKIAKRLKIDRLRVKTGIENIVERLTEFYQTHPSDFIV